jgi:hypothetical protein
MSAPFVKFASIVVADDRNRASKLSYVIIAEIVSADIESVQPHAQQVRYGIRTDRIACPDAQRSQPGQTSHMLLQ